MADELALGVMTGMREGALKSLQAVQELQIPTVQVSYPQALHTADGVAEVLSAVRQTGVEITTVFCGFAGESYADIPTVRDTVGLVPEATRAERVAKIGRISQFAQEIGVPRMAAHIGFIPDDASDARYPQLVQTMRDVCDEVASRGQVFSLETGQETAAALKQFIGDVGKDNLRVNFDPANMILYGVDKPIEALEVLSPYIESVHCKDGQWPTAPDQLGHETPLGQGAVDIPRWLETLIQTGYRGPLTIEREISGEQQKRDIAIARDLLNELVAKYRVQ